jgi:hypothetical protein
MDKLVVTHVNPYMTDRFAGPGIEKNQIPGFSLAFAYLNPNRSLLA